MMNRAQRRAARRAPDRRPQADPTVLHRVIGACTETDPAQANFTQQQLADAFAALRDGSTDDALFDQLAAAINTGLVRAEDIDPHLEGMMMAGVLAMREADGIRGRHGRYGFTGPGLQAMELVLEVYDTILRASTPAQMRAAMRAMLQRSIAQAAAEGVCA